MKRNSMLQDLSKKDIDVRSIAKKALKDEDHRCSFCPDVRILFRGAG
ncbi:MAG: hypothetical protein ACETWK_10495 [Candidatus Aminicenantaceae bacterium]